MSTAYYINTVVGKRTSLPQLIMALREAIETDNLEQVKRLFAHGISLEALYGTGDSVTGPLKNVLFHNPPRRTIFEFLIQQGFKVNKRIDAHKHTLESVHL